MIRKILNRLADWLVADAIAEQADTAQRIEHDRRARTMREQIKHSANAMSGPGDDDE